VTTIPVGVVYWIRNGQKSPCGVHLLATGTPERTVRGNRCGLFADFDVDSIIVVDTDYRAQIEVRDVCPFAGAVQRGGYPHRRDTEILTSTKPIKAFKTADLVVAV